MDVEAPIPPIARASMIPFVAPPPGSAGLRGPGDRARPARPGPDRRRGRCGASPLPGPVRRSAGAAAMGAMLLAVALAAAPAAAQIESQVATLDADHDGRISQREYIDGRAARFAEIDRNHDGVISLADFPRAARSASLAARVGRLLSTADLNNDGAITHSELDVAGTPLFYRADTNADGFVDGAERARLQAVLSSDH